MEIPEKLATYGTQGDKKPTICVRQHYTQTNTNNVTKTWAPLQTTGGKDEQQQICIKDMVYFSLNSKQDSMCM